MSFDIQLFEVFSEKVLKIATQLYLVYVFTIIYYPFFNVTRKWVKKLRYLLLLRQSHHHFFFSSSNTHLFHRFLRLLFLNLFQKVSKIDISNIFLFLSRFRSSHPRCFVRKGVLRNFAKFTGKHLCQSLI